MRKASIIGGLATGALVFGLATPAFAAGTPVHATVQVETTLTLQGISSTVAFGQVVPGTTSTQAGAENPEVITNDTHGANIIVTPENGGFHSAVGQPDQIPNSAVSITTHGVGQGTVNLGSGPVNVAQAAIGDNTYAEDWSINVASTVPAGDPLFADYDYSAVAI